MIENYKIVRNYDIYMIIFFNIILLLFIIYKIWSILKFRSEKSERDKIFLDNLYLSFVNNNENINNKN